MSPPLSATLYGKRQPGAACSGPCQKRKIDGGSGSLAQSGALTRRSTSVFASWHICVTAEQTLAQHCTGTSLVVNRASNSSSRRRTNKQTKACKQKPKQHQPYACTKREGNIDFAAAAASVHWKMLQCNRCGDRRNRRRRRSNRNTTSGENKVCNKCRLPKLSKP